MSKCDEIRRRWHTEYDRGANYYTDTSCRILAEHAFRDIPDLLAVVDAAETFCRSTIEDDSEDGIGYLRVNPLTDYDALTAAVARVTEEGKG